MTLSPQDLAQVTAVARDVARETLANQQRGGGGLVLPIPMKRTGTAASIAEPGEQITVRADGDTDTVYARNATAGRIAIGARVLIEWSPPQGVYVLHAFDTMDGPHDWEPALGGPSTNSTGVTSGGQFWRSESICYLRGWLAYGAGSSFGTGPITIGNLPYTHATLDSVNAATFGHASYVNNSPPGYPGTVWLGSTGTVLTCYHDFLFGTPGAITYANVHNTSPFSWGSGDYVLFSIDYPID